MMGYCINTEILDDAGFQELERKHERHQDGIRKETVGDLEFRAQDTTVQLRKRDPTGNGF